MKKSKFILCISLVVCITVLYFYTNNKTVIIDNDEVALGEFIYEVSKDTVNNGKYLLSGNINVNDKIYYVDAPTILSLAQNKNIQGNGYIRWSGWKSFSKENIFSGNLKVSYISDEIYTSMKLPSEVQTCMNRVNPQVIKYKPEGYIDSLGMGAIYPVPNTQLPETFDVYIGKIKTFALMEGDSQWHVIDTYDSFNSTKHFGFYRLPWSTGVSSRVPESITERGDGYMKFNLTRADLTNQVLHFWGSKQPCKSENMIGLVTIYEVWSDTPDITGKLAATIGNDQRNSVGLVQQAFSGRNYAVTNAKRLIIGHNMPDDVYDWCVANGKSPQVCLDLFYQD